VIDRAVARPPRLPRRGATSPEALCAACHARQHRRGELTFWSELGIDPVDRAMRLWTVSGDEDAAERILFRTRQRIALAALKRNAARWG
jgi:hypothetical protein